MVVNRGKIKNDIILFRNEEKREDFGIWVKMSNFVLEIGK